MERLVSESDLAEFPGAPFDSSLVDAAGEAIRTEAAWHIAPVVEETIEVETYRNRVAILPTLRVAKVEEIRDGDTGRVLEGWRVNKRTGVLKRRFGSWPEVIEVDLKHGFEKCPPELLPLVVERVSRGKAGLVRRESLASRSVDFHTEYDVAGLSTLAKYTLGPRP